LERLDGAHRLAGAVGPHRVDVVELGEEGGHGGAPVGGVPVGVLLAQDVDVRVLGEHGHGALETGLGGGDAGGAAQQHDVALVSDLPGDPIGAVHAVEQVVPVDAGDI